MDNTIGITETGNVNLGGSVNSDAHTCARCGEMIWSGMLHTCAPGVAVGWLNPPTPAPLYTVQCCPACQGRGNVPCGFYGRMGVATDTAPERCQACDGKGALRVSLLGNVEKIN